MMGKIRSIAIPLCVAAAPALPAVGFASECDQTSVGFAPINDLGPGTYLGEFQGGLYPNGLNAPPVDHAASGVTRAGSIQPLDVEGAPDAGGKYVLLSIGMSNTTQEFCSHNGSEPCDPWTFMGQAAAHPDVNHTTLRIVNGARSGQGAAAWDSPADPNYNRIRDTVLAPKGLSEAQVQAVWVKVGNPSPEQSLPSPEADAYTLFGQMADIARTIKVRYPNVKLVFFSSRIYAGYASSPLNPEPFAYESAFAVKWLIEAQIDQMAGGGIGPIAGDVDHETVAPWIAWGAYLWADGLIPRSDGLIWECADFAADGTHPSPSGEQKVGSMLLDFFLGSPFTEPWFAVAGPPVGDLDGDGRVGISDLLILLAGWGPCPDPPDACPADLDGDGTVGIADLLILLANWR
jgi:hypothetical protein